MSEHDEQWADLLANLERALPAKLGADSLQQEMLPRLADLQIAVHALLAHRAGQRADPAGEPWYRTVMEQFARRAKGAPPAAHPRPYSYLKPQRGADT